mgnify:FL=1
MPIRKNTRRIDPRYFLNETTYRDEINEEAESLLGARTVSASGLEAARGGMLAKPGRSIVVVKADSGFGGQQQGLLQVYILPKPIGFYADLDQAKNAGATGEGYYATPEAIASQTRDDNSNIGSQTGAGAGEINVKI